MAMRFHVIYGVIVPPTPLPQIVFHVFGFPSSSMEEENATAKRATSLCSKQFNSHLVAATVTTCNYWSVIMFRSVIHLLAGENDSL